MTPLLFTLLNYFKSSCMSVTLLIENKAIVPKEFNKIARRYDLATGLSQGYGFDLEKSAALLQLKGDETVLDLCCGTGKSTAALLPFITGGKITGIDNSEEMLRAAREKFRAESESGKTEFLLYDAMQLPYEENSVDVIFMAYGLRNMPDYDMCIRNLYRILKPGGKLLIHDYSLSENAWSKLYWKVLGYGFILPFCTLLTGESRIFSYLVRSVSRFLQPSALLALLQENGFSDTHYISHKSWRGPILKAFYARKPQNEL